MLAKLKNLADFEVKGKIGYVGRGKYQWQQYGKLPIHTNWSFERLDEFRRTRFIPLRTVDRLCQKIESIVPAHILQHHNRYKWSLGKKPGPLQEKKTERNNLTVAGIGEHDLRPCSLVQGRQETRSEGISERGRVTRRDDLRNLRNNGRESDRESLPKPHLYGRLGRPAIDFSDLIHEPDSFKRQKEAIFRLARYDKQVPTLERAQWVIKEHNLFAGTWEDNEGRRVSRDNYILDYLSQTFDPSKCGDGSVNIGKYDVWAKERFPNGLVGKRPKTLTPDGQVVDKGYRVHVSPSYSCRFVSLPC